ncbi:MAG: patatin-like phospholipase family protein [Sphingomonadaceae bacterium]
MATTEKAESPTKPVRRRRAPAATKPRAVRATRPEVKVEIPENTGEHLNILVLQGGGALGAYHLGVMEELDHIGLPPDWVAGISIGAVNAALIAGNRPRERVKALRRFWEIVSGDLVPLFPLPKAGPLRDLWTEAAAGWAAMTGVSGMFRPRIPWLVPPGSPGATSLYDPEPLRETLLELIDFDYLNDGPVRLSVGAVSVTTGRIHFFDNRGGPDHCRLTVDHVLASSALPPSFPPVQIGADSYWDGSVASNAPLQHVLDELPFTDKNIFQVDLFPAEGDYPKNLYEAEMRQQDIRFSSRTRLGTSLNAELTPVRRMVRHLVERCDSNFSALTPEELTLLQKFAAEPRVEIVQIIYRDKAYAGLARTFEFSRPTMEAHRAAGQRDADRVCCIRDWRQGPTERGVQVTDAATADCDPNIRFP